MNGERTWRAEDTYSEMCTDIIVYRMILIELIKFSDSLANLLIQWIRFRWIEMQTHFDWILYSSEFERRRSDGHKFVGPQNWLFFHRSNGCICFQISIKSYLYKISCNARDPMTFERCRRKGDTRLVGWHFITRSVGIGKIGKKS